MTHDKYHVNRHTRLHLKNEMRTAQERQTGIQFVMEYTDGLQNGRGTLPLRFKYKTNSKEPNILLDRYYNGDKLLAKDQLIFHDRVNIEDYVTKPTISNPRPYAEDTRVPGAFLDNINGDLGSNFGRYGDRDFKNTNDLKGYSFNRHDHIEDKYPRVKNQNRNRLELLRNDRFSGTKSSLRSPSGPSTHRTRNKYIDSPLKTIPSLQKLSNIKPSSDIYKSIDYPRSELLQSGIKQHRISKDKGHKGSNGLFGKLRNYLEGYNLNSYENQDKNVDSLRKMLRLDGKSDKRVKFDVNSDTTRSKDYSVETDYVEEAINRRRRAEPGHLGDILADPASKSKSRISQNTSSELHHQCKLIEDELRANIKALRNENIVELARSRDLEREVVELKVTCEQLRNEIVNKNLELETKKQELDIQLEKLLKNENNLDQRLFQLKQQEKEVVEAEKRIEIQSREVYEQQLAIENKKNELEYRESELNDREIQIKETEIQSQIKNKLGSIKEQYENKRFKHSQELLRIQNMISQNLEDFRRVRKQYDYAIESIDPADTDRTRLFDTVNSRIDTELEYLRSNIHRGQVSVEQIDNSTTEVFFKELEKDLVKSSHKIQEKAEKISDTLALAKANMSKPLHLGELRRLYLKKHRLLNQLKHLSHILERVQSIFEYQEDAKVVEIFGKGLEQGIIGRWYIRLKREIDERYI